MTLPRSVARFSKRWINPVVGWVVPWIPGGVEVSHVGRHSGARYTTPLVAFRRNGTYLVCLSYGPTADWFLNAAAGQAGLRVRRTTYGIHQITAVDAENVAQRLPRIVRAYVRLAQLTHVAEIVTTSSKSP